MLESFFLYAITLQGLFNLYIIRACKGITVALVVNAFTNDIRKLEELFLDLFITVTDFVLFSSIKKVEVTQMDERQLEQLMDEHADYLMKVAYVYTKNWANAEEVVQDVFIKFYQRSDQFEARSKIRTYLVKMTVNQAHDYLRSWRYKKEMLLEGLHIKRNNAAPSIEQQFQATLEKSELISKLISLPVQYREILYLYYFEDFKMREIAELLKMTEGNVRTRLSRARAQLKAVYTFSEEEVLTNG